MDMSSDRYRVDGDDNIFDGQKFRVGGSEYKVNLPRRGFLKASAMVAAGSVGIGAYTRQSQPALAVGSDDWSAADVESDDGSKKVESVIVGSNDEDLTVSWDGLTDD